MYALKHTSGWRKSATKADSIDPPNVWRANWYAPSLINPVIQRKWCDYVDVSMKLISSEINSPTWPSDLLPPSHHLEKKYVDFAASLSEMHDQQLLLQNRQFKALAYKVNALGLLLTFLGRIHGSDGKWWSDFLDTEKATEPFKRGGPDGLYTFVPRNQLR
ncbi:hypothetical protein DL98DRAFT_528354 [Cadophora sp. DSE1049]|nr:hypothetical protein DL98DRAFT_528354 [Cadophora sp. DSE1049]